MASNTTKWETTSCSTIFLGEDKLDPQISIIDRYYGTKTMYYDREGTKGEKVAETPTSFLWGWDSTMSDSATSKLEYETSTDDD